MRFYFLFIFICWGGFISAQPIYFNYALPYDSSVEFGESLTIADDNNIIWVGETLAFPSLRLDMLFIKTNANGDTFWVKQFGRNNYHYTATKILGLNNNRFVVSGVFGTNSYTDYNAIFLEMDGGGDTVWTHTYSLPDITTNIVNFIRTSDGGYSAVGYAIDTILFQAQLYVLKIDSLGNQEWQKSYSGGESNTQGFDLIQMSDKGYIIAGVASGKFAYTNDGYILRLDAKGNELWSMRYNGITDRDDGFGAIYQSAPNEVMAVGGTTVGTFGCCIDSFNAVVVRLDTSGNLLSAKTYLADHLPGSNGAFDKIIKDQDGDYVLMGNNSYENRVPSYGWLYKMNSAGDSIWSKIYRYDTSLTYDNEFWDIIQTTDQGFAIAGTCHPYTQDFWLLKVDQYGCETLDCQLNTGIADVPQEDSPFLVYPNPAKDMINLQINSFFSSPSMLSIIDPLGRVLLGKTISSTEHTLQFIISNWQEVLYLIQLKNDQQQWIKKVLVVR